MMAVWCGVPNVVEERPSYGRTQAHPIKTAVDNKSYAEKRVRFIKNGDSTDRVLLLGGPW
jgi:hypothetical protein